MSLMMERGGREPTARRAAEDHGRGGEVLRTAVAIAAAADVDELLAAAAAGACQALGFERCSIHVRDAHGRFAGAAAHPRENAGAVRRMTVGGSTDPFTREIVETRAPVLIRDTWSDPRGAQGALRAWKVRAVLGVPLLHDGVVTGVLLLDNAEAPHPYTPAHVDLAATIGRLAGETLARLQAMDRLRDERETVTRQNRLLRAAALADQRFSQCLLDGGGLKGVVAVLTELTGKAATFYDARLHRVVAAGEPAGEGELCCTDDVLTQLRETVAGSTAVIAPQLAAGIRHRHLAAPVDIGVQRCGWVVVVEHPARLTAFDELTLRRAARHLAFELAAARRATTAAWDARSLLARQLIRGTQEDDVRRGAEHLGIELDLPRVVAFVTAADRAAGLVDAERLVAAVDRRIAGDVLATKGPEGVALVVDVPPDEPSPAAVRRLKTVVAEACAELGFEPLAGLSAVCRGHADVPRAYHEAREVARCIDRAAAGQGILAADDLGPGRVFVANGEPAAMERFVDDVLGALLTGGDGTADLLRTLQCFFDTGRSIRLSAARLRVHENTVRYRLARVHGLTGMDVAGDASDQLSVQMALLVLRLQGHPSLPAFDDAVGA